MNANQFEFWGRGEERGEFPNRDLDREKLEAVMQRQEAHPLSPDDGEVVYVFDR